MSAPTASPTGSRSTDWRRSLGFDSVRLPEASGMAFGIVALAAAAAAGYELTHGSARLAFALSFVPLGVWLITHPTIPLILLGISIPGVLSLSGANPNGGSGGYIVSPSDLLLVIVGAGILLDWSIGRPLPVLRALRPVSLPVLGYAALMLVLLPFHPGLHNLVKTGQRYELFLFPLIVGAFAALTGWHVRVLKAYVIVCALIAVVFPFYSLGLQHNPAGQFVGNAILVLISVRAMRRFFPLLVVLVPGLLLIQSRGAVLATGVGVGVILALQFSVRRPALKRVFPLLLIAVGVFAVVPASLQQRLTTISSGSPGRLQGQTPGQYAIYLRQQYAQDAHRIIDAHPWTGVGVGNYYAADAKVSPSPVLDPHNVMLLQEAEGGYVFAAGFILLIAGVLFALRRLRNVDVGAAAAGVVAATFAHGLVDVYWVRGTPLLGWLLVGMACGGFSSSREADEQIRLERST